MKTHKESSALRASQYVSCTANKKRARLVYVCNTPIDVQVRPQNQGADARRAARIDVALGGVAANGAPVAAANGIPSGVVGVQPDAFTADWCRQYAAEVGLEMFLVTDRNSAPAVTVSVPNGRPGPVDTFVQCASSLSLANLSPEIATVLEAADALIIGPLDVPAEYTVLLHQYLSDLARKAHRMLIPHPSLITSRNLIRAAERFHAMVVNYEEARLLDPGTADITKLALNLRHRLPDNCEFAITTDGSRGHAWVDGHWWLVDPIQGQSTDNRARDVFATAWLIARQFFSAPTRVALNYATLAAAATVNDDTWKRVYPSFGNIERQSASAVGNPRRIVTEKLG